LLALDEPFTGVDRVAAAAIRTVLRRFVDGGGSVLLTGQDTAPIALLCDRIVTLPGSSSAPVRARQGGVSRGEEQGERHLRAVDK
jgi:ABC-2 type transport system ATP-binding protein